jgi:hypothetical protein
MMVIKRLMAWGLALWVAAGGISATWAQEAGSRSKESRPGSSAQTIAKSQDPAEEYRDLLKAYQKAEEDFLQAYRAAKTDAERMTTLQTKRPDVDTYAAKMLKLAEDAPHDPVAVEALLWIVQNSSGARADKAMKSLIASYIQDPKIGSLCSRMVYDNSPQGETLLREVLARNPGREAKGAACLALGQRLRMQAERSGSGQEQGRLTKEAEGFLERASKEFTDVKYGRGTIGDIANNTLGALRNLGIGKTAPEISGEDIDGHPLKLSDFRGKVVVLDFWGDW